MNMLSFAPSIKLEMEMKRLQGLIVESYKSLESISSEESRYLNRFAFISIIGASTRIENAVLTDREIEWVDTILNNDGRISAFEQKKNTFWTSYQKIENEVLKKSLVLGRY